MAARDITWTIRQAYDRECRGLTCLERGALWALTALADCRWAGNKGVVKAEIEALKVELGIEVGLRDVLNGLRRKGRIRILQDDEGKVELMVCFWYDKWYWEREGSKRRRKCHCNHTVVTKE